MVAERRIQEDDPEGEPTEEIRDPVADPVASFERLRLDPDEREDEVHPESDGNPREEREDREDRVQAERDEGADAGTCERRDAGPGPFDLFPHVADFVEVGRDPIGGILLALPAGHWAVGSRGRFKNLRSGRSCDTVSAPRSANS